MEILNQTLSKFVSFTSYIIRNLLNIVENGHTIFYQILNSQDIISNKYFSKISSFEQQLKTYSPFTLMTFGLLLIFLVFFLKFLFKNLKRMINFLQNYKENLIILYYNLPGPKAQLAQTKIHIKEAFKNSFKSNKFKKIEFHDNKQDYTKILAKMEQNLSNDNAKSNCGKLTGAVYCANDQIKYIAAEAAKMFLYSNLLHSDLYSYSRYLESELIKIGVNLFNGGEDACGLTTSGGTMSIINAIYGYVMRAKKKGN